MGYKKWYKADLDILKVLVEQGFTHPEIAHIIKRTAGAIDTQCHERRLCSKLFVTPAQIAVIEEMSKYGFSAEDIAKKIKREVTTVRNACYSLGIKLNSMQKSTPEEIKKAVRMLKEGKSTGDVAKAIPGWSVSMAMHLKARYKIVGLRRGGKKTIPQNEMDLLKELVKKSLTYYEIAVEMSNILGKHITEELVRGRIRNYRIPHERQRSRLFGKPWTTEEDSVLKSAYVELGSDFKAKNIMSKLLPGRTRGSIKKRLMRII